MKITFLIGNGFDLRIGMKTRFADMYEEYVLQPSASDNIEKFKEMLKSDAPSYKTWGDFEMAMAQKAKTFAKEECFIECLRDFKLHMAAHLEKEQNRFRQRLTARSNTRALCIDELNRSIRNFYTGFTPNVINEFVRLGINMNPQYNFISFNYTDVFDSLLKPNKAIIQSGEIIHIHGTLDADVVLGIDNLDQVTELPYQTTRKFERAFIKPEFNRNFDNARLIKAEKIIANSDIICIYGMSLGLSDFSWLKQLKEWLLSFKGNHLVYFTRTESKFSKLNWDAIIDAEEDYVATLLGRICDSSDEMGEIFNQIHIPVGYDIFAIDKILKTEERKGNKENARNETIQKQLEGKTQEIGV